VTTARTKAAAANHALSDEISAALRERYGAEIRLRGITNLNLEP